MKSGSICHMHARGQKCFWCCSSRVEDCIPWRKRLILDKCTRTNSICPLLSAMGTEAAAYAATVLQLIYHPFRRMQPRPARPIKQICIHVCNSKYSKKLGVEIVP